jgi:hypothetical protein
VNTEPPPDPDVSEIERLIEQSSFGAPGACALSGRTSAEIARSILDRVEGLSRRADKEARGRAALRAIELSARRQKEIASRPARSAEASGEPPVEGTAVATGWLVGAVTALSHMPHGPEHEPGDWTTGDAASDDLVGAGLVRSRVRKYGLPRSAEDLPLEALILATGAGRDVEKISVPEHRKICELCTQPRAVVEVAAHVQLPLGVAKVLINDMLGLGLIDIARPSLVDGRPSDELMSRVLKELHRKL